ncbi:hypothetical protein FQN60_005649 [Etheostoma spectabile]|uniref:Small monomeric GTPase n=1 Tax=Etheostoma spectabile TaxID=54343 RepID=A0A5J5CDV8_9PERO|nr:hypothetical protein FQN60_005649 [Etheostoma spectabile]
MQTSGPEHDDSFDLLFKIILIGDSNVGKTCLVQNFKSGTFSERQQNTIGVDFTVRTVDIDGKKVKERHVPFEEACNLAKERDVLAALETSAKESQNVEEAFTLMARELMSRNGLNVHQGDSESRSTSRVLLRANSRPVNGTVDAYTSSEKKTCC